MVAVAGVTGGDCQWRDSAVKMLHSSCHRKSNYATTCLVKLRYSQGSSCTTLASALKFRQKAIASSVRGMIIIIFVEIMTSGDCQGGGTCQ